MAGFIDIHTHIIPHVDDGSDSMAMTGDMLSIAINEGIETIVATPHFIPGLAYFKKDDVFASFEITDKYVRENKLPVKLVLGNEIYLDDQTAEKIKKKECLTIGNTKYVLLEFPMSDPPRRLDYMISCIRDEGFYPVIAHPERYHWLMEDEEALDNLMCQGCLMQINTGSITGFYGKTVFQAVKKLLHENMVHLVGTDAHTNRKRAPKMKEAYEILEKCIGQRYADQLFYKTAESVLRNVSPAIIVEEVQHCHAEGEKEPDLPDYNGREMNLKFPSFLMKLLMRKS